jgi:lauroyl/myristoyl acyltransferase
VALYLVIRVGAFLSRIIPRSWRYLIGTAVGDMVYAVWGRKRAILKQNMATLLGLSPADPLVRRLALKSMRNYCKYLIEFLELPVLSSRDDIIANMRIQGLEHLRAALTRGKGVILASAHFGTIEIPGLRLTDFTDFHAVYDAFRPAYLDRLIQQKRREKGIDLIPVNNVRAMLRVLSNGGTLAVLFDRPMDLAKGVQVRFCGHETAVPGGPAVLAMKTGATLLPVYTTREPDNSFSCVLFPPIIWTPSGDRHQDVQVIMQKLMNTLQTEVMKRPDQWYMFRPMWPRAAPAVPIAQRETSPRGPAA